MQIKEHVCVSINLYLQRQVVGRFNHWTIVCQSLFYWEVKILLNFCFYKLNIHDEISRVITK